MSILEAIDLTILSDEELFWLHAMTMRGQVVADDKTPFWNNNAKKIIRSMQYSEHMEALRIACSRERSRRQVSTADIVRRLENYHSESTDCNLVGGDGPD